MTGRRATTWWRTRTFEFICIAAWLLPIVVAAGSAIARDWYPVGDRSLLAVRANDVLTRHHPWIGLLASVSVGNGVLANHPGPLIFDLLAIPVKLFGSGTGLVVGSALINAIAGLVAMRLAMRVGGRPALLVVTAMFVGLGFVAGGNVLWDPYNPTISMFPFLTLLVALWASMHEVRHAGLVAMVTASFCVQTNIAYTIVVVPLGALAVLWWLLRRHHNERRDVRRDRRSIAVLAGVALVMWCQPLVEQLRHGSTGNAALLAKAARHSADPVGMVEGLRRWWSVTAPWGRIARRSLDDYPILERGPSATAAALYLLAIAVTIALLARWSRRHHRPVMRSMLVVAEVAVLLSVVAVARVPVSPLLGYRADYARWLWPLTVWWVVTLIAAVGTMLGATSWRLHRSLAIAALAGVAIVNLWDHRSQTDDADRDRELQVARVFNDRAAEVVPRGAQMSLTETFPWFEYSLLAELTDRDLPFTVSDPVLIRQFGESRRAGTEPSVTIHTGLAALRSARNGTAAAFASTISDLEQQRIAETATALTQALMSQDLKVTSDGQAIIGTPLAPPWLERYDRGPITTDLVDEILADPRFVAATSNGVLVGSERLQPVLSAWAALTTNIDQRAVALLIA